MFSEKDRLEWILGKAEGGGFSVSAEDLLVCDAPYRTMFIAHGDKKHKATINMVDYDGVLQVVNADNFLLCMHQGIGPAKGLGLWIAFCSSNLITIERAIVKLEP